jgi:hypothetical protein
MVFDVQESRQSHCPDRTREHNCLFGAQAKKFVLHDLDVHSLVCTLVHLMPPRLLSPSWGTTLVNAPKVHVTAPASIASSSRCSALGIAASSARVGAGTAHRFSSKAYTLPYTHINLAGPNHSGNVRSSSESSSQT